MIVGVADLTLEPVAIDLDHCQRADRRAAPIGPVDGRHADRRRARGRRGSRCGPSGRPGAPLAGVPAASPESAFGKPDTIVPVLDELCHGRRVAARATGPVSSSSTTSTPSRTPRSTPLWERLLRSDALRVVATIETRNMGGFSMDPLLNEVRKARRALYLQPDDPVEFFQTTGVKPPIRPGTPMPPGRGVLVVDRRPTMVQVAVPGSALRRQRWPEPNIPSRRSTERGLR